MGIITPPVTRSAVERLVPRLQIVATGGQLPINTDGAGASNYTRFESVISRTFGPVDCTNLSVLYAGFYASQGSETLMPNDYTLEAAALYTVPGASNRVFPLRVRHALGATIPAGCGLVATDELGVAFQANTSITIRTGHLCTAGALVPVGMQPKTATDKFANSTAGTSQVYSNTTFATPSGGSTPTAFGPGPTAILGIPSAPTPAVVIDGDSICYGQGDASTGDGNGNKGWFERGLWNVYASGAPVPYANVSRSGSTVAANGRNTGPLKQAIFRYASHVVFGRLTNDISNFANGTTTAAALATLQANLIEEWRSAKVMGRKVYQTLCTPKTTADNSAIFVANTPDAYLPGGLRDQVNAWIKTQVGVWLDGYIDPNTVFESQSSPGFWANPAYTADGLHPTQAGHTAAAAVSNAWAKTLRI